MEVLCYDVFHNEVITTELGLQYVQLDELFARSDVVSLHVPLLPQTAGLINTEAVAKMKQGGLLINCSRGGLVDTDALINGLISSKIGGAGLDVYTNERAFFFKDLTKLDDTER